MSDRIEINVGNYKCSCEVEILGGLNACFLCKNGGHQKMIQKTSNMPNRIKEIGLNEPNMTKNTNQS